MDAASGDKPDSAEPTELPFQVQILYTDNEGAVALRVLTHAQPVTSEREQAEQCLYKSLSVY